MILNLVENGPLIWPTVEENGETRKKKYEELSASEKLQADCDLKATNIVLEKLPTDVYAIANHHKVAKVIWDRLKLLMQVTSLSLQERECKLYDEFDKFTRVKGETLYYLPPEWSKFMTDVKLARDFHTTNYDQLYSYIQQHELPQASLQPTINLELPQIQEIRLLSKIAESMCNNFKGYKYRVMLVQEIREMLQVQGQTMQDDRQGLLNAIIVKEKGMLAEAHESGQILDEEQPAFLADSGIIDYHDFQPTNIHNAAFQTDDLDAYDSGCYDISSAKAVLMANLTNYNSDILSKVPNFETYQNDMDNQSVQAMQHFE
ncbi:hypothetical protein Tco_0572579 [Tanacetum coccineum]